MKDIMTKILVALMVGGITAGATSVVKTYQLETKVEGQDKIIMEIHKDVRELRKYFLEAE